MDPSSRLTLLEGVLLSLNGERAGASNAVATAEQLLEGVDHPKLILGAPRASGLKIKQTRERVQEEISRLRVPLAEAETRADMPETCSLPHAKMVKRGKRICPGCKKPLKLEESWSDAAREAAIEARKKHGKYSRARMMKVPRDNEFHHVGDGIEVKLHPTGRYGATRHNGDVSPITGHSGVSAYSSADVPLQDHAHQIVVQRYRKHVELEEAVLSATERRASATIKRDGGKFPIPDKGHAKAALARINQSDLSAEEKARVRARAQKVLAEAALRRGESMGDAVKSRARWAKYDELHHGEGDGKWDIAKANKMTPPEVHVAKTNDGRLWMSVPGSAMSGVSISRDHNRRWKLENHEDMHIGHEKFSDYKPRPGENPDTGLTKDEEDFRTKFHERREHGWPMSQEEMDRKTAITARELGHKDFKRTGQRRVTYSSPGEAFHHAVEHASKYRAAHDPELHRRYDKELREAADSMAKASTPEPFSTSKTSNWVARGGGLPAYIQHIAHDIVEKRGKTVSEAIRIAIGVVKNWAHGHGNVDKGTRAAALKALAEWTALKAKNAAKKVAGKLSEAEVAELALIESWFASEDPFVIEEAFEREIEAAALPFALEEAKAADAPVKEPKESAQQKKIESAGERVQHLQRRLSSLGFETRDDGDFGPKTAESVKAFQRNAMLTEDGIVGPKTTEALKTAPAPSEMRDADADGNGIPDKAEGPEPVATGEAAPKLPGGKPQKGDDGTLYKGMGVGERSGHAGVKAMQGELADTGIDCEDDGRFGPETEKSVKRFQRKFGLKTDGIVGPKTRRTIKAASKRYLALHEATELREAAVGGQDFSRALARERVARERYVLGVLEEANAGFEAMLAAMVEHGIPEAQAKAIIAKGGGKRGKTTKLDKPGIELHRMPNGMFAPKGSGQVLQAGDKVSVPHKIEQGTMVPGEVKSKDMIGTAHVVLHDGPDQGTPFQVSASHDPEWGMGAPDKTLHDANPTEGDALDKVAEKVGAKTTTSPAGAKGDGEKPLTVQQLDSLSPSDKAKLKDKAKAKKTAPVDKPSADAKATAAGDAASQAEAPKPKVGATFTLPNSQTMKVTQIGDDGKVWAQQMVDGKPVGQAAPMSDLAISKSKFANMPDQKPASAPVPNAPAPSAAPHPSDPSKADYIAMQNGETTPVPKDPKSLAMSPGRGPTGKLRNFKAMGSVKLKKTIGDLHAFGQDEEALSAAKAVAQQKGVAWAEPSGGAGDKNSFGQPLPGSPEFDKMVADSPNVSASDKAAYAGESAKGYQSDADVQAGIDKGELAPLPDKPKSEPSPKMKGGPKAGGGKGPSHSAVLPETLSPNVGGYSLHELPIGGTFALNDGSHYVYHKDTPPSKDGESNWIIAKPMDGGKAKPFHKMLAPAHVGPMADGYDGEGGTPPSGTKPSMGKAAQAPTAVADAGGDNGDLAAKLEASVEMANAAKAKGEKPDFKGGAPAAAASAGGDPQAKAALDAYIKGGGTDPDLIAILTKKAHGGLQEGAYIGAHNIPSRGGKSAKERWDEWHRKHPNWKPDSSRPQYPKGHPLAGKPMLPDDISQVANFYDHGEGYVHEDHLAQVWKKDYERAVAQRKPAPHLGTH